MIPELEWTDLDRKAVDTARVLAMDAVQKVGNGHPGTAMSLAPAAYLLFQKVMRHDPADPDWMARDRFVLSCGHSSITLYTQLFLGGFGLELADLEALRTWGSKTPGHPEFGHTAGVEVTTGPLGQGVANAVGMAMAARREKGLLDPGAGDGPSLFDHHVYVLASDGDLEEGVSSEASSIAGTQELGNLTVIYDANRISIEGDTHIAFNEDVAKRYEAYGWHVQTVDWTGTDHSDLANYEEDVPALYAAVKAADEVTDKPSLIVLKTVIAWPAPNAQNTEAAHGSALGADEVAATKAVLGFDPDKSFEVPADVLSHTRSLIARGKEWAAAWTKEYDVWAAANPEQAALLHRMKDRRLPDGIEDALPVFEADAKGVATRAASGKVINAVAAVMPELWGGSADLAGSNNTTIKDAPSFLPLDRSVEEWQGDPYQGRVLHFGIREHGMGAIMNGIAVHGGTRVFGGTFLTFSDYMRGAVRVGALMKAPVVYVWTHDSIGLGEDGPTHQPIEHLAALRAIPGLDIIRPADANETAAAWLQVLRNSDRPAGLILSRQNVPTFPRGTDGYATTDNVAKGGYVLLDAEGGQPDVVLLATGSEVQHAVAAREKLAAEGVGARVVSLPCLEWFEAQTQAYRDQVIPPTVKARVSVEAGVKQGWREYVGDAGRIVSIDHYGASADAGTLFREFGFTPEAVVQAAKESIAAAARN
ncbi:transketolase [Pimelobacter simplex]|uniref:Transketolase n=1 Tax=Nocardioides simplex TaxID=2045 RepID=A0A0A1DQD8_NOCSI|nr:transketolase [Pimelobacter simplex]AIY17590.1 Transketolase [Pimelobacter simplex]MCG8150007.1 transketolase [Pimelobacter simplex]GEB13784.1 transketolase [Pimelobacter simplex]SFM68507.1 transketolase [Pimelobacter simplex]